MTIPDAAVSWLLTGITTYSPGKARRVNFLSELAKLLSGAGWLLLTRLLAGDESVAWNYGFQFAGSWFYYQPTFDARWRQYSPGFCLLTKMVEQACDNPDIHFWTWDWARKGTRTVLPARTVKPCTLQLRIRARCACGKGCAITRRRRSSLRHGWNTGCDGWSVALPPRA